MMMTGKCLFALSFLTMFSSSVDANSSSLRGQPQTQTEEFEEHVVSPSTERKLIIGGNPAKAGDYPYFSHMEGISCGGSLIAPDVVLTAGHVSLKR